MARSNSFNIFLLLKGREHEILCCHLVFIILICLKSHYVNGLDFGKVMVSDASDA
jgi:hypothetical protein